MDITTNLDASLTGTDGAAEAKGLFNSFLISCSDCPALQSEEFGIRPGSCFTHANPGNSAQISDMGSISALHLAVDHFVVERIVVCGHKGCTTIRAVVNDGDVGVSGDWLRHVEATSFKHRELIAKLGPGSLADAVAELNVIEQVSNVCRSEMVRSAWDRGRDLTVSGLMYEPAREQFYELDLSVSGFGDLRNSYARAIGSFAKRWNV
jgi:carbonic anhydrase